MSTLEKESQRRARRGELQSIILQTVKTTGLVAIAIMAPNVIGAMHKLGLLESSQQIAVVKRASTRLVRAGFMQWHEGKLRLTERGEMRLRETLLRRQMDRPRRWDKKWRVLIFDIPERRAGLRQRIRNILREIGFVLLQDSVWVYPHDCEDLIVLLKADLKIGNAMLYMIVDTIENDKHLRTHFGV